MIDYFQQKRGKSNLGHMIFNNIWPKKYAFPKVSFDKFHKLI